MVTRQQTAARIHVPPPDAVPLGKDDGRQAIEAIAAMIAQWRREHGRDDHPPDVPHPTAGIMTEPADAPP
jgi:hypothetical protein